MLQDKESADLWEGADKRVLEVFSCKKNSQWIKMNCCKQLEKSFFACSLSRSSVPVNSADSAVSEASPASPVDVLALAQLTVRVRWWTVRNILYESVTHWVFIFDGKIINTICTVTDMHRTLFMVQKEGFYNVLLGWLQTLVQVELGGEWSGCQGWESNHVGTTDVQQGSRTSSGRPKDVVLDDLNVSLMLHVCWVECCFMQWIWCLIKAHDVW